MGFELVDGDGEAARGAALMHVDENDRARAGDYRNLVLGNEIAEFRCAVFKRAAMTPDAYDFGRSVQGHEHDTNAPISRLVQVSVCFYAASRQVHVPERALVKNAKVLASFGGNVDVAMAGKRSATDPEYLLLQDPGYKRIRNGFIEDAHDDQFFSVSGGVVGTYVYKLATGRIMMVIYSRRKRLLTEVKNRIEMWFCYKCDDRGHITAFHGRQLCLTWCPRPVSACWG